jgi:hypothetical protein
MVEPGSLYVSSQFNMMSLEQRVELQSFSLSKVKVISVILGLHYVMAVKLAFPLPMLSEVRTETVILNFGE